MFKSCKIWRKKKPVKDQPCVLSWTPIIEAKVVWPTKTNDKQLDSSDGNETKTNTEKTIDVLTSQTQDVSNQVSHGKSEQYKHETLEVINVDKPKIVHIEQNNYSKHERFSAQSYKVEQQEISNDDLGNSVVVHAQNVNNNEVFEVQYGDQPKITKEAPKIQVDDNDNHLEVIQDVSNRKSELGKEENKTYLEVEAKKSNASLDFRLSSLSNKSEDVLSDGGRSSAASLAMTRRKALRDDDEDDDLGPVQLISREITDEDQEIIKKALHANDFIMAVAPNAVEDIPMFMTLMKVNKGDVIMKQNEHGNCMYVSKSGEYQVKRHNQTIKKFKGPRLFGELAILYDTERSATVLATSDGFVWQIQRQLFKALLRQSNITADNNILEFLSKVPVINEASPHKIRQIANLCQNRFYPKDTIIIREGQKGNEFFIIKTGRAQVTKVGQGKIKTLEPGDFFGERALLDDLDKRKATVTAIGYGVHCLVLTRQEFNEYLGDVRKFLADKTLDEGQQKNKTVVNVCNEDRFLPYKDLVIGDFVKEKLLGEGGFGTVHLVKCAKGKTKYFALKEMRIKKVKENKCLEKAFNERDIQKQCDSMFIVQLYRTFKDDECIYFLLEYCPRAELFTLLRKKKFFDDPLAKFTAACVLEALAYLHCRCFAYLDLKPENIFIDKDGYPKVGDFGNAVMLEGGKKSYCFAGTLEYMAPEIVQQNGTDMAADYWAFGVLIYEMLMGKSPFVARSDEKLFNNIATGLTSKHFPQNFNKYAKDLIRKLIEVNPSKRIGCLRDGVEGLYRHEWFKEIDFVKLRAKQIKSPLLSLYKRKK